MANPVKLEIKRIGNSTGLILPKELVGRINLDQGHWRHVTESADGTLPSSPNDSTFERSMKFAEKAMKTYRDAFAELAKGVRSSG